MSDEPVTVATYRFAPKAEMARVFLEQEGITAFVADAELVTTDWLLGGAVGHVKLQVPASQAARANELVQQHPQVLDRGRRRGNSWWYLLLIPFGLLFQVFNLGRRESASAEDAVRCLSCGAAMTDADEKCPACGWTYASNE